MALVLLITCYIKPQSLKVTVTSRNSILVHLRSQIIVMISFIIICVAIVCGAEAYTTCQDVPGYYWRDFTGEIPYDALPGGTDINGKPIYIGQIFNLKFLIPAKIYSNNNKAYYEYGGKEHVVTTNIKILCAQHPEDFQWIRTNNAEINLLTDKHLIIGGFEPGCTTYIGRVRSGGEILVGKALADNLPQYAGLHVTRDGQGIRYTSFEVLAYSPIASNIDTRSST